MPCIFCQIVDHQIPSSKIYEDVDYLAFLDISQFTLGHTIVIPKTHLPFVWDSPQIGVYFTITAKIANHFRSLGYRYVDSLIFGRNVPHAHIHLIPHNDDPSDYKDALFKIGQMQADSTRRPSPEEADKIARKFRL